MAIYTAKQALAFEIKEQLRDERPNSLPMYMAFIKRHGEHKIRALLSEVLEDYRMGKIDNAVKVFMYRVSQL
jgi:hypothetical protein